MALIDPGLAGLTEYDEWGDGSLTASANPGYPGFPGSGAWPAPISSPLGADAQLAQLANGTGGGPYPAGGSLYYGGFSADIDNDGGLLAVQDATPLADLANLVFQIQIGEAWTYDFLDEVLPVLSLNGGATLLAPDTDVLLEQFDNGTVTMPTGEETVYINTYLLQWDLTAYAGSIGDFSVEWNGVQHAQVYQLRLDQSDSYAPVPEPGTFALSGLGLLGLSYASRKRTRRS